MKVEVTNQEATKTHVCAECHLIIERGQEYVRVSKIRTRKVEKKSRPYGASEVEKFHPHCWKAI